MNPKENIYTIVKERYNTIKKSLESKEKRTEADQYALDVVLKHLTTLKDKQRVTYMKSTQDTYYQNTINFVTEFLNDRSRVAINALKKESEKIQEHNSTSADKIYRLPNKYYETNRFVNEILKQINHDFAQHNIAIQFNTYEKKNNEAHYISLRRMERFSMVYEINILPTGTEDVIYLSANHATKLINHQIRLFKALSVLSLNNDVNHQEDMYKALEESLIALKCKEIQLTQEITHIKDISKAKHENKVEERLVRELVVRILDTFVANCRVKL